MRSSILANSGGRGKRPATASLSTADRTCWVKIEKTFMVISVAAARRQAGAA
jgi:hypothetical protein